MSLSKKVAICVHVYYEDRWEQIADYLANMPAFADIFVTCRKDIKASLSAKVTARFPAAEIHVMPNLGMDVLPFLLLVHEKKLYEYSAVLKLHTKNTKSKLRADQGKLMFDGLCGSPELVNDIIDVFQTDRQAGMIGTAFQLRSANALMYGNRARMEALLDQLAINLGDWPFFTGTMFWIAGPALRDIADLAPALLAQTQSETQGRTGGDGTLAHTLERVFGALCKSAATNFYLTEPADPDSGRFLVVPMRLHGPGNHWRLLELDSTDLLRRYVEASHWCQTIRDTDLFQEDYYTKVSNRLAIPGMDPVYHFVLYGDLFQLDPSANFDTTYYQLRRQDVVREKICSLAHYLHAGHRDGTANLPNADDWFHVAERFGLFDAQWYSAQYPDVALTNQTPEDHFKVIGQRLGRASSPRFDPKTIPVLAQGATPEVSALQTFLQEHFLAEEYLYKALKRAGRNGDFALARLFASRLRNQYGSSRALNEALATSYILNGDWEKGKQTWRAFWDELEQGTDSSRHGASGLGFDRPSQRREEFRTIESEDVSGKLVASLQEAKGRVCVYTTLFGDIDDLIPVLNPAEGVDYLCFTDRPRKAVGWTQIVVDPQMGDNNLNAKVFKVLPHKYLQDYEYSMFVDANTVFLGRVNELIGMCMLGGDFVMWQHPLRDDPYVEVNAIIAHRRHAPEGVLEQMEHYAAEGLPTRTAMFEASFIWRKHMAPDVVAFMEKWWHEIDQFSKRDQLSLAYLVWKTGVRPTLLSPELGTSRANIFFFKASHRNGNVRDTSDQDADLGAPVVRTKDRDITFLYSEAHAGTGSTVLRGQQLSGLVKNHYGEDREVHYSSDPDISNQIIVLTKGFLKTTTAEQLHGLGQRNLLIADFVDEPPMPALINEIDVLMGSSLLGYKSYMSQFPNVPAFHVTHHVDTRIPHCAEAATDSFRSGYFGELVNTIRDPEIEKLVSFNLVDTSKQTHAWIDELAHYNFHYAFRRTRGIDGAKPFLKGFVAAHCGANMMIQESAGDAPFYLGSDYPYLMDKDASIEDIVAALQSAHDNVGGAEWRYGREIMRDVAARSSLTYVMGEFNDMISAL